MGAAGSVCDARVFAHVLLLLNYILIKPVRLSSVPLPFNNNSIVPLNTILL